MKTNLKKLSTEQLNETKGGYYVNIILPDGTRIRIRV
jgi:hypothetical protein